MTQAASIPIERHDGNDAATEFAFNHYLATDDELVITHKTTAGVVTTPILDTDYTVAGGGSASVTVTFPKAGSAYSTLASGSPAERLTFIRATDLDRLVDMANGFFFDALNAAGDKMQRQIQELSEKIGRAAIQTVSNSDAVPTLEEVLAGTAALDITALDALGTLTATDLFHVNDGTDKKMAASVLATYIATLHFLKTDHINTSAGAGSAGKPIILAALGLIHSNMIPDGGDSTAIHDDTAAEIAALSPITLADGDSFMVEDLDAGTANSKLKCLASAIWTYILAKIASAGLTLGGALDMNSNDVDNAKAVTFIAEVANTGTTPTIDWGAGQKQKLTLTGATTPTDPFTAPDGPGHFSLKVVQAGTGSYTITWPAAVLWPTAGTAPILSTAVGAVDIISFYYDGTSYYGQAGLDFQ